jgi:hypothetical protein
MPHFARPFAATCVGLALLAMSGCGLLKPPRYCCVAASNGEGGK